MNIMEAVKDILIDLEMTRVDTYAYLDSAKEKVNRLIVELESEEEHD